MSVAFFICNQCGVNWFNSTYIIDGERFSKCPYCGIKCKIGQGAHLYQFDKALSLNNK